MTLPVSGAISNLAIRRAEIAPGYSVAKVINGCWQLASDHGGNSNSEKFLFDSLRELIESGFSSFDCADIYTGVEEFLGRFIRQSGMKNSLQLHTKFVPDLSQLANLQTSDIKNTIHRSIRRLGVERLDLVQFHWWDYAIPGYLEALEVLNELRQSGDIRYLGLTNFDMQRVQEILDTEIPITSLQLQFSLLDRRPQKGMTDICREKGISLFCYGTLAGGLISERQLGMSPPPDENRSVVKYRQLIEEAGGWQRFQDFLYILNAIAKEAETSIASLASRWVLDQPGVDALILGLGNSSHVQENLQMLNTNLSSFHTDAIEAALLQLSVPRGDVFELERDMDGPHAANMKMNLNAGPKS
ncbi:MAG: aryl-alcohol dehydrogenase-like predicted oxidoreductase [Lysobacterales bacterium]